MKFIISILILFSLNALADKRLEVTPYDKVKATIGKGKPTFLIFGSTYCHSCIVMGTSLYNIKEQNENYNIHYVNIDYDRIVIKEFQISAIPMQVIYDKNGTEVYTNLGLMNEDELNELFEEYKF